jgi:hypothetical protein
MLVKADTTKPIAFAVVLTMLLGYRVFANRPSFLRAKKPIAIPTARAVAAAGAKPN